jgi:plastocyanin
MSKKIPFHNPHSFWHDIDPIYSGVYQLKKLKSKAMKQRKLFIRLLMVASISWTITACSKDSEERQVAAANETNNGSPMIVISNGAFSPNLYYVVPGANVTWVNRDGISHSVIAENGAFNSGDIPSGGTFSYIFTTPGAYSYSCGNHPEETGIIYCVEKK